MWAPVEELVDAESWYEQSLRDPAGPRAGGDPTSWTYTVLRLIAVVAMALSSATIMRGLMQETSKALITTGKGSLFAGRLRSSLGIPAKEEALNV
jgi:hypothetical protein